jgi:hypothetical protein
MAKRATSIVGALALVALAGCGSPAVEGVSRTASPVAVEPTVATGRIVCTDIRPDLTQLYTDIIPSGADLLTFTEGPLTVNLDFTADGKAFDWESNLGIDYVLVGTPSENFATNVYAYSPEATAGEGLRTPYDDRVYYVKFCYDPEEEAGCTLTPGYWKTHSKYGPAGPTDETWALVGEDSAFFLSGKSYYEVLWTPPRGNPYYNLSFHFIAAKLNVLAGASDDDVTDALADAESLFETYTPAQAAEHKAEFLTLAATLGRYNEGYLGPGHCE